MSDKKITIDELMLKKATEIAKARVSTLCKTIHADTPIQDALGKMYVTCIVNGIEEKQNIRGGFRNENSILSKIIVDSILPKIIEDETLAFFNKIEEITNYFEQQ